MFFYTTDMTSTRGKTVPLCPRGRGDRILGPRQVYPVEGLDGIRTLNPGIESAAWLKISQEFMNCVEMLKFAEKLHCKMISVLKMYLSIYLSIYYLYTYTRIHIYTYTHIHIYTYTHVQIYTYRHIDIYIYISHKIP